MRNLDFNAEWFLIISRCLVKPLTAQSLRRSSRFARTSFTVAESNETSKGKEAASDGVINTVLLLKTDYPTRNRVYAIPFLYL